MTPRSPRQREREAREALVNAIKLGVSQTLGEYLIERLSAYKRAILAAERARREKQR